MREMPAIHVILTNAEAVYLFAIFPAMGMQGAGSGGGGDDPVVHALLIKQQYYR
jgi:hypothetical protein